MNDRVDRRDGNEFARVTPPATVRVPSPELKRPSGGWPRGRLGDARSVIRGTSRMSDAGPYFHERYSIAPLPQQYATLMIGRPL
ncbi:MAG: hypothetical protein RIK87_03935 [Fuerstiella sp.]